MKAFKVEVKQVHIAHNITSSIGPDSSKQGRVEILDCLGPFNLTLLYFLPIQTSSKGSFFEKLQMDYELSIKKGM